MGKRCNRGIEDEIERLETAIPGIGGMYIEGADIVVYVPKDAARENVISALARAANGMAITPDLRAQLVRGERILLKPAKFAMSQLLTWEEALEGPITRVAGLTGIDADESLNQVRINVADSASMPEIEALVVAAGIPLEAVAFRIAPMTVASQGPSSGCVTWAL